MESKTSYINLNFYDFSVVKIWISKNFRFKRTTSKSTTIFRKLLLLSQKWYYKMISSINFKITGFLNLTRMKYIGVHLIQYFLISYNFWLRSATEVVKNVQIRQKFQVKFKIDKFWFLLISKCYFVRFQITLISVWCFSKYYLVYF